MTITKETELVHAIIVYCQRCREEGDYSALNEMGIGPREAHALTDLSATDQLRLASIRAHFLTIKLNHKLYWRMIDYIARERQRDIFIKKLIANDAPLPMMHSLTGMGSKQYSLIRREAGLESARAGRPQIPAQEVTERVWKALKEIIAGSKDFGPREFLKLFDALNEEVPLRVIWYLFYRWEESGKLKVHRTEIEVAETAR